MPSTDTRTTELAHTRYKVHWQVNDPPGETLASGLNPVHHAAVLYAQLPRDVLDYEKLPGGHFSQDHLDVWRGVAVVVFEARVAERFYCHQVSMRGSGPSRPLFHGRTATPSSWPCEEEVGRGGRGGNYRDEP